MILNEDCYSVLLRQPNSSVDLFLQDTPFGVTKNKWDIKPDFQKMWPEWLRVGKKNCAFLFFATQPFASELILSMSSIFRYDIIWEKTQPTGYLNAKKMPLRAHESILVFYRNLPKYNPQKTSGHERKVSTSSHKRNCIDTTNYGKHYKTSYDSTDRYPRSVLRFPSDKQKSAIHPTQKPVALIQNLVRTYSNEGDVVFDGYGGSGTTEVACILEKRISIVCENDGNSFNKSIIRLGEQNAIP